MDISLYYEEYGEGEPLLLLHGNNEDGTYFKHQIEAFAKHYRVIVPDTRGHGKTPRGNTPFTIRQFADDLLAFMDEHHIKRAHILGFSDGGNIALIFALRYPQRVNRLILNGANLYSKGVIPSAQVPVICLYHAFNLLKGVSSGAKKGAEMMGLMVGDPNIDPQELVAVQAKTLVIAGTKDLIKREHTELIHSQIPCSKLVFVEGDHFLAAKNPAAFNAEIEKFLLG